MAIKISKLLQKYLTGLSQHLFFARSYSQWQNSWERLLFGQFCVSTPFPLLTMLKNNEQKLRQALLWVRNIVKWERGTLKTLFKIPTAFCHWLYVSNVWFGFKHMQQKLLIISLCERYDTLLCPKYVSATQKTNAWE